MQIEQLEKRIKEINDQLNQSKENINITEIKDRLQEIDAEWKEGAVREKDGSIAPGQAHFSEMLNKAHELVQDLIK